MSASTATSKYNPKGPEIDKEKEEGERDKGGGVNLFQRYYKLSECSCCYLYLPPSSEYISLLLSAVERCNIIIIIYRRMNKNFIITFMILYHHGRPHCYSIYMFTVHHTPMLKQDNHELHMPHFDLIIQYQTKVYVTTWQFEKLRRNAFSNILCGPCLSQSLQIF